MKIEIDVRAHVVELLLAVEREYNLSRERAISLRIVAGESELTRDYVARLLESIDR